MFYLHMGYLVLGLISWIFSSDILAVFVLCAIFSTFVMGLK